MRLAIRAVGLLTAGLVLSTINSEARDDGRYANSSLKRWFESLRSKRGEQCCSDADGRALADVDWETKNGHYRVRIEEEWIDVPDETVITEPNRFGRAILWPFYLDGRPTVRCFMPGSMT